MKWKQGRRSGNVEDRRGMRLGGGPLILGGSGAIVILVVAVLLGADPTDLLRLLGEGGGAPYSARVEAPIDTPAAPGKTAYDEGADFVSVVLADTEDTWSDLLGRTGRPYEPPRLVLFSDRAESACGFNSAAVGPFYRPADRKVYIDLAFYQELRDRFGAPGDFAQAYVIAHEVGHHVQNLLGISDEVHADAQRQRLEEGDIEEALHAAAAIGDDRLQHASRGAVHPESWTRGSSEQRTRWFRRGLESGRPDACDTFGPGEP